ncbi:MAG: helix-turn-helix transcriptional regulator [Pseudomonadota bacterium]
MNNKEPSLIDKMVGQLLRKRRRELKLTQEELGEIIGLAFQQIQKYERGANRIPAGRLYEFATALGVDISYFYQDAAATLDQQPVSTQTETPKDGFEISREGKRMLKAFERIECDAVRSRISTFIVGLAETELSKVE